MSWKPEIQVAGDPKWYDNAVRFKTELEARKYAADLFYRWTSAKEWRVVKVDEPANSAWVNGEMQWKDVKFTEQSFD